MRGPEGVPVGKIRRVIISNIVAYDVKNANNACTLSGMPGHTIEDIQFSNIWIYYKGGRKSENNTIDRPEKEKDYPEPGMFGSAPAYGFYVRHAKNIQMDNINIFLQESDKRPAFLFDDVKGLRLDKIAATKSEAANDVILRNVSEFSITNSGKLENSIQTIVE
jgi:hypothetical protein